MLEQRYFQDGHLTQDAFSCLDAGELSAEERRLLLVHMEDCAECMDVYLETLTDEALLEPPEGMEERIISVIHDEYTRQKQSRILVIKFTKLAVAVCLTMVLFMGGVFQYIGKVPHDMLRQQVKTEQSTQSGAKPERERPRENTLSKLFGGFNKGFIDFAKNFNSFSLIGDGKK